MQNDIFFQKNLRNRNFFCTFAPKLLILHNYIDSLFIIIV